ncbi:MAG: heterodisulfide reductase-related iron-sulfur binding cluster [Pseudomonadota bacterium]
MNPLINAQMVDVIRASGKTDPGLPDRIGILEKYALPYDQPAENAVITGCQILGGLPHILASLSRVLKRAGFSHTFLSEEYCCGNNVYRPAIKAKDEKALAECRDLSREFLEKNITFAKKLGAKRLVIFCSPCYPIYKHAFPYEDIVFYPTALNEIMPTINLHQEIDYYAGCYRLHRKFAPTPMDLKSTNQVFEKIEGLKINRVSAPQCCYKPEGLQHMLQGIRTGTMVHICTGCYVQALVNHPQDKGTKIMMLPEFVEAALGEAGVTGT